MTEKDKSKEISEITESPKGYAENLLFKQGLKFEVLETDHLGIEIIAVKPLDLYEIAYYLKSQGFNYLQCQGGYDEGPGENLVCFYHLVSIPENDDYENFKEIRLKVFLSRDSDLTVPSLYSIYRGSDWQERETFDMYGINFEGHPHPKRLLMPEDWKGWPLRKDYVQPDFYEMQDAY
tara:strand:- start:167 stop:700 length:534 start_codon:yes stop_codon:yes gene_type:complete